MIKPTLSMAILSKSPGNYYEFRRYGAVIHRFTIDGERLTNYWFKETPEECIVCKSIDWEQCENPDRFCSGYCAYEYELNEAPVPCRICGTDCRGGDYLNWHFCSRGCMVDY
jgi:hypothetical protein